MPNVSIFIPAFNVESYIGAAINSVLSQTYTDWELIVLDDCSTDDTCTIAKAYANKDKRIQVFRNNENLGMLGNWNKGITLCTAPIFVKLDADDKWDSQMLSKSVEILEKFPGVGLVFSRYCNIDTHDKVIPGSDIELPDFARNKSFSCVPLVKKGPDEMLSYSILRQGLSVMRRNVFDKVGKYRYLLTKQTQAATDTEFYFRVGAHYSIYCIDDVLYFYRVHSSSISATDSQRLLTDQKIYEIKYSIIKYYKDQHLITNKEATTFIKAIQQTFNYACLSVFTKNRDWQQYRKLMMKHLLSYPLSTFRFYFNRGVSKYF